MVAEYAPVPVGPLAHWALIVDAAVEVPVKEVPPDAVGVAQQDPTEHAHVTIGALLYVGLDYLVYLGRVRANDQV